MKNTGSGICMKEYKTFLLALKISLKIKAEAEALLLQSLKLSIFWSGEFTGLGPIIWGSSCFRL